MSFSKRDRANITVHSLIGYCQSARVLTNPMVEKRELQRWADGLVELAEALEAKLNEPGVQE